MSYPESVDSDSSPEQQLPRIEGESHEDYLDRLYDTMADELISGKLTKEDFKKMQKAGRLRLEHEATHDGLTGLLNYKGFREAYQTALDMMSSTGSIDGVLAFVDIDKLKDINDSHGHQIGNELIKIYIEVINTHIEALKEIAEDKNIASIVGRYGGDEFVFFIRGVNEDRVKQMADSILERIPNAVQGRLGKPIGQSVSIGLASLRSNDTIDSSIDKADRAMYQAKSDGGNQVIVSST